MATAQLSEALFTLAFKMCLRRLGHKWTAKAHHCVNFIMHLQGVYLTTCVQFLLLPMSLLLECPANSYYVSTFTRQVSDLLHTGQLRKQNVKVSKTIIQVLDILTVELLSVFITVLNS